MDNFKFNYIEHYKKDGKLFNYFEEKTGATLHDERRVHEFLLSLFPKNINNVLDVGSGSAWIANHLCRKNIQVTSFDISLDNLKNSKLLIPIINHSQVQGDSFNLPFKSNSFDCIVASEVIEHVQDPQMFINELFRCVANNGYLILSTPYKEKLKFNLCVHCNNPTPVNAHIHSFDEFKLKKYFENINIERIEFKTFGNKVLIFLRTYTLLKFLNFTLWNLVDKIFNKIYFSPAHILVKVKKTN